MSERDHVEYGPCDGFGPNNSCSACTGLIEREDGSWIWLDGTVAKKAPLRRRVKAAWAVLKGGIFLSMREFGGND